MNTFAPQKPKLSKEFKNKIIKNYDDNINKLSKILNEKFCDLWFQ